MKVKPAVPGAIIRDPHTKRPLPAEGADVPDTNFWRRRLHDGDVELVGAVEVRPARAPEPAAPVPPLTTNAVSSVTTREKG